MCDCSLEGREMGLALSHLIKPGGHASLSGCTQAASLKHAQREKMNSVGSGSSVAGWVLWISASR